MKEVFIMQLICGNTIALIASILMLISGIVKDRKNRHSRFSVVPVAIIMVILLQQVKRSHRFHSLRSSPPV